MHRKTGVVAAIIAAGLALTACASSAPSAEPTTPAVVSAGPTAQPTAEPTAEPTTPAASEPETSVRGNLVKRVGDPFGVTSPDGNTQLATFVVTALTVNPQCTGEYVQPSENGVFVRMDLQGETTPEYEAGNLLLDPAVMKIIAENGTTFNGLLSTAGAYSCLADAERLNTNFGPAERVVGSLIFDVPTATGIIVNDNFGAGGWEWVYPQ